MLGGDEMGEDRLSHQGEALLQIGLPEGFEEPLQHGDLAAPDDVHQDVEPLGVVPNPLEERSYLLLFGVVHAERDPPTAHGADQLGGLLEGLRALQG